MNLKTCEISENNIAEIIVDVSSEEFDSAVGKSYIKNRKQIAIPGFRKGKAPRGVIEKMYGAAVFHSDALDILLPEVMTFAVEESELDTISAPIVKEVDLRDDKSGAEVTVIVAVYPEVTIGAYKGLSAAKPEVEVSELEIDKEIAAIRLRNARIEKVDRAATECDIVNIDFEGFIDNEPFDGGKAKNF